MASFPCGNFLPQMSDTARCDIHETVVVLGMRLRIPDSNGGSDDGVPR